MKKLHTHTWLAIILGLLPLAAAGIVVYLAHRSDSTAQKTALSVTAQPQLSQTASPTTAVAPVVNSPATTATPAATPTPTVSPSASASATALPDSAKAVLANFYAAYASRDRARLATFFTSDTTTDDQNLHVQLFSDPSQNPTGQALFTTNATSQYVSTYSLTTATTQGANWVATVQEQRMLANGSSDGQATTLVTLVPSGSSTGPWLIDRYAHAGSTGKYDGFFVQ